MARISKTAHEKTPQFASTLNSLVQPGSSPGTSLPDLAMLKRHYAEVSDDLAELKVMSQSGEGVVSIERAIALTAYSGALLEQLIEQAAILSSYGSLLEMLQLAALLYRRPAKGRPRKHTLASLSRVLVDRSESPVRQPKKYSDEFLGLLHERVLLQVKSAEHEGARISAKEGLRKEIDEWWAPEEPDAKKRQALVAHKVKLWEPRLSAYRTKIGERRTRKLQEVKKMANSAVLDELLRGVMLGHVNHRPHTGKEEHGTAKQRAPRRKLR